MLLYSGHKEENALNTDRFALRLSKESRKALIGCESHGSRIIKASFREKEGITMNVIVCYAPTNDNNEDDKNHLYGNAATNQN
ncbi:unnamed protein product [Schistosoma mattheei]|uniref:Uncharacterized protein n=1 Tax=Schistosoma mattheei TaxID=31246 RepID=A0A183P011_9TREM|nr:unnamed protein product [Schistosoma mattheei]